MPGPDPVAGNGRTATVIANDPAPQFEPASTLPAVVPAGAPAAVPGAAAMVVAPVSSDPAVLPPAMVAVPARPARALGISSVFAPLLGGWNPQSPLNSPVQWVMMAAALGQIGQGRSGGGRTGTAVPGAAAVATFVAGPPTVRTPRTSTGLVTGNAWAKDSAGRTVTYSAPSTSTGGGAVSINSGTGEFNYTPTVTQRRSAGANTTDTFSVSMNNGVQTISQVITVAVDPGLPVSGTPYVRTPSAGSGVVTGIAKGTDTAGRTLTYTASSTSAGGAAVSINSSTGDFTYTPTASQRQNAGSNTTDTFTVTASNGVRTATRTITVLVDPGSLVAGTPFVRIPRTSTGLVTGNAWGKVSVGGPVSYSVTPISIGGGAVSINGVTGDFSYTPTQSQRQSAGANTTDTFTVTATSGGRSVSQVITVAVDPGIPVPGTTYLLTAGPVPTSGVVTGTAKGTDTAGRTLSYSTPSTSSGGATVAINSATGDYTYTPTAAQRANAGTKPTDTFTVSMSNGVRVATQTITVAVDPVYVGPVSPWAMDRQLDLKLWVRPPNLTNGQVTGITRFTYPIGIYTGPLTYSCSPTSAGGATVSINSSTGDFTYTPTQAQRQNTAIKPTDTFTVTGSNGHGRFSTRTVAVLVDPI